MSLRGEKWSARMPEASLLEEMKKRKVVQWGLAYVAVAWVVAQVVETVAGPWNIPDNMIRNVHMVLIGGVPIAVILSWFHGCNCRTGCCNRCHCSLKHCR
jgi:hypothetical protein